MEEFNIKRINSLDNILVKEALKLHDSKGRKKINKFLIEGYRAFQTAVNSNLTLDKVFVTEENLNLILELVKAKDIILTNEKVIKKISISVTSSGIIGIFFIPNTENQTLTSGLVAADITDPGNMGTLIRTSVACGLKSIVRVEGVDPWNQKVVQASAGTISQINIFNWDWQTLITNKKNFKLNALVVSGGKSIKEFKDQNSLLVVGNEARGIKPEWLKDCDNLITLPMPGQTESLNAAIAGSIALYLTFVKI